MCGGWWVGVQVESLSRRVSELVVSLKEQAAVVASLHQQATHPAAP